MSKYNEELPTRFVELELGKFLKQNQDVLNTTVGETILIIQATTNYIDDLLQGMTSKEQRSLVVDSTLEHTKKLMLMKVGKYEEQKASETNAQSNDGAGQVGKKTRKAKAVHNKQSVRKSSVTI
jgi:hypothetical protein